MLGRVGCHRTGVNDHKGANILARLLPAAREPIADRGYDSNPFRTALAFGRLKDGRRIATRYDRCATIFFGAVTLAAIVAFWLKQWVLSLEALESTARHPITPSQRALMVL